ncbi:MAG TPA: DUF2461 domain-containing protein, partial [Acidimicrobiales bacterium]|nr:DUF2461 domain-containing protein [Acidimicrobiales bacterium]
MTPAQPATPRKPDSSARREFRGWSDAAIEFFEQIELDNSKVFWAAHKDVYETEVLEPMQALLAELERDFGPGKVFRPYRDVRFSADKSPYKTNVAAHNRAGYISLSSEVLGVGSGLHMPSPDQLTRYRAAVAHERTGPELVDLVRSLRKNHVEVGAQEVLKSAPRGYAKDHSRIDLLRHRGLTAWRQWPVGEWLSGPTPKRRIVEFLRATTPLRK